MSCGEECESKNETVVYLVVSGLKERVGKGYWGGGVGWGCYKISVTISEIKSYKIQNCYAVLCCYCLSESALPWFKASV